MNIKEKKENEKLVVSLDGKIDTNTSPVLLEYLQEALKGVKELEFDFEKVDYISSAGLRVLLYAQKTMNAQGTMVISHVNEDIMETFELTCFTDILTII